MDAEDGWVRTLCARFPSGNVWVRVTMLDGRKFAAVIDPAEFAVYAESRVIPVLAAQPPLPELHY